MKKWSTTLESLGRRTALAAVLIVFSGSAMAQSQAPAPFPFPLQNLFQGTPEEQAACRPDSNRFCRAEEPDQLRVLACLKRHRPDISTACRRVLERYGH